MTRAPADSHVLLGCWVPQGDAPSSGAALQELETRLGRKLDLVHRFYAWADPIPTFNERQDADHGRLSMITWEPRTVSLADINSGSQDQLISAAAQRFKGFGKSIFLRWGHEMNSDWYRWGGDPQAFVSAWRRIHDIFVREGALNVLWVWSPNVDSVPNESWNQPRNYYPGDAYVDWIAVDGYNWGSSQTWSKWREFADIFQGFYDSFSGGKPFMIAETGSAEQGGNKAQWVASLSEALRTRFPRVSAVVWFDDRSGAADWRVDSSPAAFAAFRQMAQDLYAGSEALPALKAGSR